MTTFTITVQDEQVRATLKALAGRVQNMQPVLQSIGVAIVERTQHRFDTSTGPDGRPWKGYPPGGATLTMLAERIAGKSSYRTKAGALNKRGREAYAGKKILIGESKHLMGSFNFQATPRDLTVASSMAYAAIHQFGGKTGASSMIPGKTIPARPFLPVRQDGALYPQEQALILQKINEYLMDRL